MPESYNWQNIGTLLVEGFSANELRNFCFYTHDFKPLYSEIPPNANTAELVRQLIDYANQKFLFIPLLAWAKEFNPTRYEIHQPYYIVSEPTIAPLAVSDASYRTWLRDYTDAIDIRGIATGELQQAHRFPLLELYTELFVRSGVGDRIPLKSVVESTRCTTILGEPGSGKTTFLRYLARTYVVDRDKPLPLFLRLTDLYNHILASIPFQRANLDWNRLLDYWLEQSNAKNWGFTKTWLVEQFLQGQVIMLLDGLDELPGNTEREQIVQIIDSAVQEWPKCWWVLSSRPGVLRGKANPENFPHPITIDVMADEEIRTFIRAWVSLLFHTDPTKIIRGSLADQYISDLWLTIRDRQDIRRLARNPVMLTAIAVVHWNEKKLPEGRADLYEAVIGWLIKARRDLPNRPDEMVTKKCYQLLALEMFQDRRGRQIMIGIRRAAGKIATYLATERGQERQERVKQIEAAEQFLTQEEIDTGIVVRREQGNLTFWHLSFQEYLAACEVASKLDTGNKGWWPLIKEHLNDPEWNDLLRFVPVRLLKLGNERVDLFIKRILNTRKDDSLAETARVVGFLGGILYDLVTYKYSVTHVKEYVLARNQVMQIFDKQGLELDLRTRYEAAITLGRSGDPRLLSPTENWVRIPGGTLWVGAQNKEPELPNYDELAGKKEQPVHQVYTASFEIGKYPVTVQKYARFVEDSGYQERSFWSNSGWNWRSQADIASPNHWDQQLTSPNRPVVDVNWYEADAYCNWLTHHDDEMNYCLPTEAEWEYVARHGQETYSRYCFGHETPETEINSVLSKLDHLAPVGLFPLDVSNDGVMDMNGNILEWMRNPGLTDYLSGPIAAGQAIEHSTSLDHYCLRGGSWNDTPFRSASRAAYLPQSRRDDVGFRVVRVRKPIPIKGKRPTKNYLVTLADVFAKHMTTLYSDEAAERALTSYSNRFPRIRLDIISKLFPKAVVEEKRPFERLPCVLGDTSPTKLDFNLLYQDTRLKLAVEEKLEANGESGQYERDAQDLMQIVSILLCTAGVYEHALWRDLTDNDLDALMYMVLDSYDPDRTERLLKVGYQTNELALAGLPPQEELDAFSLDELISYQVFAGTVWWSERGSSLTEQFSTLDELKINDVEAFKQDTLSKEGHLIFFFDDNGELVWDLALIQRLLSENTGLRVTGVVSTQVVANNSSKYTLERCLNYPNFHQLKHCNRFVTFQEDNFRSAIDPGYCSGELLDLLQSADWAFIKGVSFFETIQKLPVDAYYAFAVYSHDSQTCTDYEKGSGIFVRIPRQRVGYRYQKQTLRQIYPTLKP